MKKITLLLLLFLCAFTSNAQVVTTIAGSTAGYTDAVGTSALITDLEHEGDTKIDLSKN